MPRRRVGLTSLDTSVLAVLTRGENYCQAIAKDLTARSGEVHFETSVNRALLRLTREGLLASRWENPDDEAQKHQGPPRRYFWLTGKAAETGSPTVPTTAVDRSIA